METKSLADLGVDPSTVGLANATSQVLDFAGRPPKGAGVKVNDEGDGARSWSTTSPARRSSDDDPTTQPGSRKRRASPWQRSWSSSSSTPTAAASADHLEALTAARALGEPSAVVIGAPGIAAAGKDALAQYGAQKVYVAESDEIDSYLVAPKAEVLAQLVAEKSPAAVVIPSSPEGKEVAGRLAIKTNSGFLTDVTEIAADGTATQVAFAGSTIVHSKVTTGTPIYTLRGNSVTPSRRRARRTRRRCRCRCPTPRSRSRSSTGWWSRSPAGPS